MGPAELYTSLSSEAERYKSFDDTEAIVDFYLLPNLPETAATMQRVVFGAIRKDTVDAVRSALKEARVKVDAIDIHPLNTLRTLAGTGVLDNLVSQIGVDAQWGTLFVEPERIRVTVWQDNEILELREVSMNTEGFVHSDASSPYILDLVDEMRRTTKSFQPAVWLTEGLPPSMLEGLGGQLGVPVRACFSGPKLQQAEEPASLAAVGATLYHNVRFPFEFDFLAGAGSIKAAVGKKKSGSASKKSAGSNSPLPRILIGVGTAALVLGVMAWVLMALVNVVFLAGKIDDAEKKQTATTEKLARLSAKKAKFQAKYDTRVELVDLLEAAKIRNAFYVNLAGDLRNITPSEVWVYDIDAGNHLTIEGKALTHQSVLRFSRKFDQPELRA